MTYANFLQTLFERVGEYRANDYNIAAISFIRGGAGIGGEKLEANLESVLKHQLGEAKKLHETEGLDNGYRAIITIGELLMPAAVRDVYYAEKRLFEKESEALKSNVAPLGDAWGRLTGEEPARHDSQEAASSAVDEDMPRAEELRGYVEQLFESLLVPVLVADQVVNGWKAGYDADCALPYLTTYNGPEAPASRFATLDSALNEIARTESERTERRRQTNTMIAQQAGNAWQ